MAPAVFTSLNWSHYDQWLRQQGETTQPSPVVYIQKPSRASGPEDKAFPVDRALVAQLIDSLDQAGAKVIGVDIPLHESSPPGLGGVTSDAMFLEAVARSGNVILSLPAMSGPGHKPGRSSEAASPDHGSLPLWSYSQVSSPHHLSSLQLKHDLLPLVAHEALDVGHGYLVKDPDHVQRRVPLVTRLQDAVFPAFSLALYARYISTVPKQVKIVPGEFIQFFDDSPPERQKEKIRIPVDAKGRALFTIPPSNSKKKVKWISLDEIQSWLKQGNLSQLRSLVSGKLVVLSFPESGEDSILQATMLASLFEGGWVTEASPWEQLMLTVMLSWIAAWIILRLPGWKGPVLGGFLVGGVLLLGIALLEWGSIVIAIWSPILAIILSSGLVAFWAQGFSGNRIVDLEGKIRLVQGELRDMRETLVTRESTVESLEEDLEAARLEGSKSAGKAEELLRLQGNLQRQCEEAKIQEAQAREKLERLTQELDGLKAVTVEAGHLRDTQLERLRVECQSLGIVTCDPQVLSLFSDLKKAARSTLPIVLQGEPGTGKELFARAVHRQSPRAARPFVPVNMAAISPELFESELFGHMKGSFTGALNDRKGFFELANHGTIFLDEIGDLPFEQQGKLLRVLQEKTFYRVGATVPTSIDVRVVAATNKVLMREVSQGQFREDLFFRLKGLLIHLPPLRERRLDIPLLADSFVTEASEQNGREGTKLSGEAMQAIESHRWHGNIRELQQVIHQAVALSEGKVLTKRDLRLTSIPNADPTCHRGEGDSISIPGSDEAVLTILRDHEFDMQSTARALGWDRSTVTQRLKGMGFRALVETRGDILKAAQGLAGRPELATRVQLKLQEYYQHLIKTLQPFEAVEPAIQACRKRFKNLPERHFKFVELLIRQYFDRLIQPPTPH